MSTQSLAGAVAKSVDPTFNHVQEHYGREMSLGDTADAFDNHHLVKALQSRVNISLIKTSSVTGCRRVQQVHTGPRVGGVDHITLTRRWKISLDKAKQTIQRTTQRGVRTVFHPTLSRRFRTNDRHLRYQRMPCNLYSDTLISTVVSFRQNKYAQIFASDFGWSRSFPMARKSNCHEALSLLFQREGPPLV